MPQVSLPPRSGEPQSPSDAQRLLGHLGQLPENQHDDYFPRRLREALQDQTRDIAVVSDRKPTSAYLAHQGSKLQVEVYDPAGKALGLVLDGSVVPVR